MATIVVIAKTSTSANVSHRCTKCRRSCPMTAITIDTMMISGYHSSFAPGSTLMPWVARIVSNTMKPI